MTATFTSPPSLAAVDCQRTVTWPGRVSSMKMSSPGPSVRRLAHSGAMRTLGASFSVEFAPSEAD